MHRAATFKKPMIKATSRAYVHLFGYFSSPDASLAFLERYQVKPFGFGMQRQGGCAVRVVDPSAGQLAALRLEIPKEIKYHTYVATGESFWQGAIFSDTQCRNRTFEVGYARRLKDEICRR